MFLVKKVLWPSLVLSFWMTIHAVQTFCQAKDMKEKGLDYVQETVFESCSQLYQVYDYNLFYFKPLTKPSLNTKISRFRQVLKYKILINMKKRLKKTIFEIIISDFHQIKSNNFISKMYNKLAQSQSTIVTARDTRHVYHNPRDEQTMLKNPFSQNLPMKFPKNTIRKQTSQTMLTQTIQNPEPFSVRVYEHANRSRFFQDVPLPLTQTEKISRHPQYLFDSYNQRKLSNPGLCSHLARESMEFPVRLRTFEDIGVTHNEKRTFSRQHYRPDPIVVGERELRHNSSLEKVWGEERRHRDNGLHCQKTVQWNPKLPKREPYRVIKEEKSYKNLSYKDRYLKARGMQN